MTLSRRSFMAALAGLPVIGRVLQRAPLPSDVPTIINNEMLSSSAERAILTYPYYPTTAGTGAVSEFRVTHVEGYGVVCIGPAEPFTA